MAFPLKTAAFAALLAAASCGEARIAEVTGILDTSASDIEPAGPPDAEPGACYGREIRPAVFETVTEHRLVRTARPGSDGETAARPAVFRTKTKQRMIAARHEEWFKVPCEDQKVPDYAASLQRALRVRGYYVGPLTGRIDPLTRLAIRHYQRDRGFDSAKLSLRSARALGLSPVRREG